MTNRIKELVMKTEAIYYSGQGVIYRCPECNKVDRAPYSTVPKSHECRFCEKEIEFEAKSDMTPHLYKVIGEINRLETGTVFGASMEDLKKSNLYKAGKSVGIDVLEEHVNPHDSVTDEDIEAYFASKKMPANEVERFYNTPDGKEILEIMAPLLLGNQTPEKMVASGKPIPHEIISEGRMRLLMKRNKGLTVEQKKELLKKHGFDVGYSNREKCVYVFFASSYAPECDQWVYWKD